MQIQQGKMVGFQSLNLLLNFSRESTTLISGWTIYHSSGLKYDKVFSPQNTVSGFLTAKIFGEKVI